MRESDQHTQIGTRRTRRVAAPRRELTKRERTLLATAAIVGVLALWEIFADARLVNPIVTSSPHLVVVAGYHLAQGGKLGRAVAQSAGLFVSGFGCALVSGLALGLIVGWYGRVGAVVDPWVSILYSTPLLATIPLIMVWAGISFLAQIIVVWLVSIFPIVINVAAGVNSADRHLITVARSYRGTNWDVLSSIAIPGAVPNIVAGVRQGMVQALVGVVVAEYFVGNNGLGGMIFTAGETLDMSAAFVGVVIFSITAVTFTGVLRRLQRRVDYWRVS